MVFDAEVVAEFLSPGVARRVADGDRRLVAQIILAREEIRSLGEIPKIVRLEADALRRDVERRATWTSIRQAGWLWDALEFDRYEKLHDPPRRVSGLLAPQELAYIREVLRGRLEAAGKWESLKAKRKERRKNREPIEKLESV